MVLADILLRKLQLIPFSMQSNESNPIALIWIKSFLNTWSFCVLIICEHFNIYHSQMK